MLNRYEIVTRNGKRIYREASCPRAVKRDLALEGIPSAWIRSIEQLPNRGWDRTRRTTWTH